MPIIQQFLPIILDSQLFFPVKFCTLTSFFLQIPDSQLYFFKIPVIHRFTFKNFNSKVFVLKTLDSLKIPFFWKFP